MCFIITTIYAAIKYAFCIKYNVIKKLCLLLQVATGRKRITCKRCKLGLTSKKGHRDARSHCLNMFADEYGYMPLVYAGV